LPLQYSDLHTGGVHPGSGGRIHGLRLLLYLMSSAWQEFHGVTVCWIFLHGSREVNELTMSTLQLMILMFLRSCSGYSQSLSHVFYGVYLSRGGSPYISHIARAARLSIVYSILRVANPRNALRRIVYGIVVCFAIMWVALVIQKVFHCEYSRCDMGPDVAITLLICE